MVLAQDRDRFSREPAYAYLLRREFEEHGCRIRALNDRGDDSPEGELTDGILDQLAKYERAKMAERTRRGKLQKAREGRVMASTPNYGFRFNAAKDGLVVCEPEMAVVEKIFRMAAEGLGLRAMQTRLRAEGISSPQGRPDVGAAGAPAVVGERRLSAAHLPGDLRVGEPRDADTDRTR